MIILDCSLRLPGPYCTYLLGALSQGRKVKIVRIEWLELPDPFSHKRAGSQTFQNWYQELNSGKKTITLSWNNPKHLKQFFGWWKKADLAVCSWPAFVQEFLKLKSGPGKTGPTIVLNLTARHTSSKSKNKNTQSLHDLNLQAELGILKWHLSSLSKAAGQNLMHSIPGPSLPWAGILFAHQLAIEALHLINENRAHNFSKWFNVDFENKVKLSLLPFKNTENPGPHSGLYLGYGIYQCQSKNSYVALGFLEKKFWPEFLSFLHLPFDSHDFLSLDPKKKKRLSQALAQLSDRQAKNLLRKIPSISFIKIPKAS